VDKSLGENQTIVARFIKTATLPFLLLWCWQPALAQQSFDHSLWQQLLEQHVLLFNQERASQVDYAGMVEDRDQLGTYLQALAGINEETFSAWSEMEQLAFLLNAYNAWTVELILTEFPNLESIRDLGSLFRSPWSRRFVPLFGEQVSLDHIEHELIRGPEGYGEPRIHFAVNCASIGCPALRQEAYVADRLEQQLEEATRLFLADKSRNRLDGNTLRVSEIFDWYKEDFEQGWRGSNSVGQFLALYQDALELPDSVVSDLEEGEFRIRNLKYDWSLNSLSD